jgi:trigger factor
MKVSLKNISESKVVLTISADAADMAPVKKQIVANLVKDVKMPGFREGKVPVELAEKQLDPNMIQAHVLDEVINQVYTQAVVQEKLRVVASPKIEIKKFVPFTDLEYTAEVDIVGAVKLPNYKTITVKKQPVKVTEADVKEVLNRLQLQGAEYTEVERAAKDGDRVWIDFEGTDAKGEPVNGATGKEYPLALGSNTFIPGFEENLVGLKKDEEKTFTIPFPKDYGVKALQGKKVTFKVTVTKLEGTKTSEINDEFAKKMGPFKDLAHLKQDIKAQITEERERQAAQQYENDIIKSLVAKLKIEIPQALLDEQIELVDREFRQNLTYRGQTIQEYLEASEQTEEQYKENELIPVATERIKAGLMLSEIANKEGIDVSDDEVTIRLQIMKGQYQDAAMQAELDKPEARRDIASRLLTEKTIAKLVQFANAKS